MVIVLASEVVLAPMLSTAVAATLYTPGASPVRVAPKGALVTLAATAPFSRKSTRTTLPSGSDASAATETVAGATYVKPSVGAVRLITGAMLGPLASTALYTFNRPP